jgi:hypothetical protein
MSEVLEAARRARTAAAGLAPLERQAKDAALLAMASALEGAVDDVLAANARDVDAGREAGTSASLLDRLTLTPARVTAMADGLRHVATLPDPVGEVVRGSSLPNGLELRQVRGRSASSASSTRRAQRHRRRRRAVRQERQRGAAARQRLGLPLQHRARRGARACRDRAGLPEQACSWCRGRTATASRSSCAPAGWSTSSSRRGGVAHRGVVTSRRCRSSRPASATAPSTWTPPPTSTWRLRSSSTPRPPGRRCATPRDAARAR